MKKIVAVIVAMMITLPAYARSQENADRLLADIAGAIDVHRSKTLTLRLKLKHVDRIFERITFYDRKNHDITFDISGDAVKRLIAADMLNCHEGLDYFVTFVVTSVGAAGELSGDLKGFRPVLCDAIPERK